MEVSLHALQADDLLIAKRWTTGIKELENLETKHGRVLCWLINYNEISIGLVYLFHIHKIEKTAYWGYCLDKKYLNRKNMRRVLELNLYDYAFDVLGLEMIFCETACYNNQYCVTENEWHDIRLNLSYEKVNYDFKLKPHHIGYAVANLRKALEKYRKLGYYQASEIFDDVDRNIQIVFIKSYESDECIELISPLSEKCPVSGILQQMKNVSSPYHICYETEEFERAITVMKQKGFIPTTNVATAIALHDKKVIFMMNREAGFIELVEK